MSASKNVLVIKVADFIKDFRELNSSYAEMVKVLKTLGLSEGIFYNWKSRMTPEGLGRVNAETYNSLISVSGLSYDDYFVEKANTKRPKTNKSNTPKVHYQAMKNGIKVATYSKPADAPKTQTINMPAEIDFGMNVVACFKKHMQVYRRLLGIHTSTMVETYGIDNYAAIEDNREPLSITTYIKISKIFMTEYNKLPESPLKDAFTDLAKKYKDIIIQVVYFS